MSFEDRELDSKYRDVFSYFQFSLRCYENGTCSNTAESCIETTVLGCNSVL